MDADSSFMTNKRQKLNEGDQKGINEGGGTELCDLPQELLPAIISNLPLKQAVRTSVLSKLWKDKWTEISKVELEEEEHEKRLEFKEFVEKLLAVCNTSCFIKFSLTCEVCEDAPQVNRWLSQSIKNRIQDLKLDFDRIGKELLVLPEHMFSSKSLIHFHLTMPQVINLPPSIYFPNLKTLTLRYVIFPDTTPTQKLFSSCSSLEHLALVDCNWSKVRAVNIACSSLESVSIREWRDDDEAAKPDDENEPDVQNDAPCRITITGSSNLKTFSYDGDLINDYFLNSSAAITDGTVEVHTTTNDDLDAGHFVFKLLKALSNVEKLSITDFAVQALCGTPNLIPDFPLFNNLIELRVVSVAPLNFACPPLLTLLRNSPNLQLLDFIMGVSLRMSDAIKVDPLPTCFSTHLKTIRISGFTGNEKEMVAIRFLLQSPALKSLCVYSSQYDFNTYAGLWRLDMLYKRILWYPKASEDCDIELA
ncbi:putative F-box/FBD/LRR-repeat protein At1g78760 [Cajanus cajan]|uniref:putative F-box/FBD/LRR-repeat protein At1g78760 n=1 Tax=Cajanus cajan TaxID=3821 RepID=UPI00098DC6FA|nr:putative F-box/FBD/LRR-repeat protein At1g78760 [Cajanus cajan]